jgi:hypothetical protein
MTPPDIGELMAVGIGFVFCGMMTGGRRHVLLGVALLAVVARRALCRRGRQVGARGS